MDGSTQDRERVRRTVTKILSDSRYLTELPPEPSITKLLWQLLQFHECDAKLFLNKKKEKTFIIRARQTEKLFSLLYAAVSFSRLIYNGRNKSSTQTHVQGNLKVPGHFEM